MHWLGREKIRDFISSHRNGMTVRIRGKEINDPKYLDMLATVHFKAAHHSHGEDLIAVNLAASNGDKLNFTLAKDSEDSTEYHVYLRPYATSSIDSIGSVITTLLKQ